MTLRNSRRRLMAAAALAVAALTLAACGKADTPSTAASPAAPSFTAGTQNSAAPLTVWVDSTRLPGVQAYQKAHPGVKLNLVTYNGDANGSNYLQTKVELYNRAGSGWPDVVFTENVNDITWATESGIDFAAPLNKGYVPSATLDGFATNALSPCTFGGNVYCLRNDLAQNVLWYNKKLLSSFGYQVPATWQQYEALGEKVAKQHPGYIVGTVGDAWALEVYFWASQCPANQVTPPSTLTANTGSPDCTRMASLLDTLVKDKAVSTDTVFSAGFAKNTASKVLMLVGPSWYGQTLFDSVFKTPAGQIAAAPPLTWGGGTNYTGDVGGGAWIVSAHSGNLKGAAALATWMATSNTYQATAGTYPAYKPAAAAWLAGQAKSGYFANDVAPAFTAAAGMVWPGWSATKFSQEAIWAATVVPALTQGKTITSMLGSWQTAIRNQAQALGYTVK